MRNDDFKKIMKNILNLCDEKQPLTIIRNNEFTISPQMQKWVNDNIFAKNAMIMSKNIIAQFSLE